MNIEPDATTAVAEAAAAALRKFSCPWWLRPEAVEERDAPVIAKFLRDSGGEAQIKAAEALENMISLANR